MKYYITVHLSTSLLQVAVYISPHRIQQDDRGLVVVGASVEVSESGAVAGTMDAIEMLWSCPGCK